MRASILAAAVVLTAATVAFGQQQSADQLSLNSSNSTNDNRYGLFNSLDRRSVYGQFWFPEPLNSDEGDVDNEVRLDWTHAEKSGHQFDGLHAEVEHAFGLLTVEIGGEWESDRTSEFDGVSTVRETEEGFGNVELAARYPIYEFVSPSGAFDDTFVFGVELALPAHTEISHDTEIVPKIFNLMKVGDHFSLQTAAGLSMLVGPDEGGLNVVEYDAVFGYEITREQMAIPGVLSVVPILEFDGEYTLNQDDAHENSLFGVIGGRINLDSVQILSSQPRIGLGYMFPLDHNARDEFRWGVITSVVFEY